MLIRRREEKWVRTFRTPNANGEVGPCGLFVLRHGRDVHPTWVKSYTGTLSNTGSGVLSTRAKSKEDFDSY